MNSGRQCVSQKASLQSLLAFIAVQAGLLFAIISIWTSGALIAQVVDRTGEVLLTEGTRYMIAFPQVWPEQGENPLLQPMTICLTAHQHVSVHVSSPANTTGADALNATYIVEPGKETIVYVPTYYMSSENELVRRLGISLIGDKPFSAFSYQAWAGNGDVARHLPIDAWDTEYRTMNFYQDRFGNFQNADGYRPSQIVVVAAYDSTFVTYTPTWHTEGSLDMPSVKPSASGRVVLNRGETYLIRGKVEGQYNRDFKTDLSGTLILGSKPIAVVSGHTKVGIMRYPDHSIGGIFSTAAHFVRNNVHDVLLPNSMAGSTFVTIPCRYKGTRITGFDQSEFGVDDDRGDVIRFVFVNDQTTVYQNRAGTGDLKTLFKGRLGETRVLPVVEEATYWQSDKHVLMCQYGKSNWKLFPPQAQKDSTDVQGFPTIESSMPMMQIVPSIDRWVSIGSFYSPADLDNFVGIACRVSDLDSILLDGVPIQETAEVKISMIAGRPYVAVTMPCKFGLHKISSLGDSVRWMAWFYGSKHSLNRSRSYGSPVAVDLTTDCSDSIEIVQEKACSDVTGIMSVTSLSGNCGRVFSLYADTISNYQFQATRNSGSSSHVATYSLRVKDGSKDAAAKVVFVSASGRYVERWYFYKAPKITLSSNKVDLGLIGLGETKCTTITVTNSDPTTPFEFTQIISKKHPSLFRINPAGPLTILPGEQVSVEVCVTGSDIDLVIDTIAFRSACLDIFATVLIQSGRSVVRSADVVWKDVSYIGLAVPRTIVVENQGDIPVSLLDVEILGSDTSYFSSAVELKESLPLHLPPGGADSLTVNFYPTGIAERTFLATLQFFTNSSSTVEPVMLTANTVSSAVHGWIESWLERVIDSVQLEQGIQFYAKKLFIENISEFPVQFNAPVVGGPDSSFFFVADNGNVSSFPVSLSRGTGSDTIQYRRFITIGFKPTQAYDRSSEREFKAVVRFATTDVIQQELTVPLQASAWQPHIASDHVTISGLHASETEYTVSIPLTNVHYQGEENVNTGNANGTHPVVVSQVAFEGAESGFDIFNRPSLSNPLTIQPGETRHITVAFRPTKGGMFTAAFSIHTGGMDKTYGSAPYTPSYRLTALVTGGTFSVRGDSADQFAQLPTDLFLHISNNDGLVRRFKVSMTFGSDPAVFANSDSSKNIIVVLPGQTVAVPFVATPRVVTKYTGMQTGSQLSSGGGGSSSLSRSSGASKLEDDSYRLIVSVVDIDSQKVQFAELKCNGLYVSAEMRIRSDYTMKPNTFLQIPIELINNPDDISVCALTQFVSSITFDSSIVQVLHGVDDIVTAGMQTDGWTVLSVRKIRVGGITVELADLRPYPIPLDGSSNKPVFAVVVVAKPGPKQDPRVDHGTTIAAKTTWKDITGSGEQKLYCFLTREVGYIAVQSDCSSPICLRGINPNPVTNESNFRFSIAEPGPISIRIFDAIGRVVSENTYKIETKSWSEVLVNASSLPSGVYFYQISTSTAESSVSQFVIIH